MERIMETISSDTCLKDALVQCLATGHDDTDGNPVHANTPRLPSVTAMPQSLALAVQLHQSGRLRGPELAAQPYQSRLSTNKQKSTGANVASLGGHTHLLEDDLEALDDLQLVNAGEH